MSGKLDVRRLEVPIVQAALGGVGRHELAAAVSDAGGLGTIAGVGAGIEHEVAAVRALTSGPVAVNLLLPFLRPGDREAAAAADAVVTFWGRPRRPAACTWIHQCGSVEEAKAAAAEGADAVIAQGVEAGGHVRGTVPLYELLERIGTAVKLPVLAAGGIIDRAGVSAALEAGAAAAVVGTRFLLSDESRAHPGYKQRCLTAQRTILTDLFGLGWPDAPHRVVPNAATDRWLGERSDSPAWIAFANRALSPLVTRLPASVQSRALARQRPSLPLLSPRTPTRDDPPGLVDSGPLYAGEAVTAIDDILPAAALVRRLTP